MKFILALLIASSQAVRVTGPGGGDLRNTPYVQPPAEEVAQNVNAPAPPHSNEPVIIEHVHKGRVESESGS